MYDQRGGIIVQRNNISKRLLTGVAITSVFCCCYIALELVVDCVMNKLSKNEDR